MKKVHFIDCGANIGQSTHWALDNLDVYRADLFEHLPFNFDILNKEFNDTRIFLHQESVWKDDGTVKFYPQDYGRRVGSSLIKGKWNTSLEPILVKSVNLATWIKENVSRDYYNILKLDIEGAEYNLLPHFI